MRDDTNSEWIRRWSQRWTKWQAGRLPPRSQHSAIVQDLQAVNSGSWYRVIIPWDYSVPEDQRTTQVWSEYLTRSMSSPCFVKLRANGDYALNMGVQIVFSDRGDLTTFALTYPDSATNYREFSGPEFEAFLMDTLTDWAIARPHDRSLPVS